MKDSSFKKNINICDSFRGVCFYREFFEKCPYMCTKRHFYRFLGASNVDSKRVTDFFSPEKKLHEMHECAGSTFCSGQDTMCKSPHVGLRYTNTYYAIRNITLSRLSQIVTIRLKHAFETIMANIAKSCQTGNRKFVRKAVRGVRRGVR